MIATATTLIPILLFLCLARAVPREPEPLTLEPAASLERRTTDCDTNVECCTFQVQNAAGCGTHRDNRDEGIPCAYFYWSENGKNYRCRRNKRTNQCQERGSHKRKQCPSPIIQEVPRSPAPSEPQCANVEREIERAIRYVKAEAMGLMGGFRGSFLGVRLVEVARWSANGDDATLQQFQRLVDRGTLRENLMKGRDYEKHGFAHPKQSQYNKMQVAAMSVRGARATPGLTVLSGWTRDVHHHHSLAHRDTFAGCRRPPIR